MIILNNLPVILVAVQVPPLRHGRELHGLGGAVVTTNSSQQRPVYCGGH
jgi:hypothetical protein